MSGDRKIILPGETAKALLPESWHTMLAWTEAFSAHLESQAMARADMAMKRDIQKRAASAHSDAARSGGDPTAYKLAANQQAVLDAMGHFDPEVHNEMMSRWRALKRDLDASGWDMKNADIEISEIVPHDTYLFYQGNPLQGLRLRGQTAQMAMLFLIFVRDTSARIDPNAFVRETLAQQGIHNNAQFIASGFADSGLTNPFTE